jgi:hypothetical protein
VQAAEVSNAEARADKLIADAALQMESYLAAMDGILVPPLIVLAVLIDSLCSLALAAALFHCGVLLPSSQRLELDKLLVALLMGQRPDLSELPYRCAPSFVALGFLFLLFFSFSYCYVWCLRVMSKQLSLSDSYMKGDRVTP